MPGASVRPPLPPRPNTNTPYSTYPRPGYGGYGNMGMGMYGSTYRGFGQFGMSGLPDVSDENGCVLKTICLGLLLFKTGSVVSGTCFYMLTTLFCHVFDKVNGNIVHFLKSSEVKVLSKIVYSL